MIAELRSYTISPGHGDALFRQFEELSLPLFAEHGITAYGPWRRALTKGEQLVYVVEFADEEDRRERWTAFLQDPRWVEAQAKLADRPPYIAGGETIELTR